MKMLLTLFYLLLAFYIPHEKAESQTWKVLLDRADSLSEAANYDSAIVIGKLALEKAEAEYGAEDSVVARVLYELGIHSFYSADYGETELLWERALAIQERILGPEHPDIASSLNGLANLYSVQGNYAEAELLFRRALAIREKVFGPEHPRVGDCLNNLAVFFWEQGKYTEAEPLFKQALAITEKAFGPDHPEVASSFNNLAVLLWHQGKYTEAGPLFTRALIIWEETLGSDHPTVAKSLNNLATLFYHQGNYTKAEPLYRRALEGREKAFGPDHPDVAQSLINLANLFRDQARYSEAESLYRRALVISEKVFGLDHPYVAQSLNNLAILFSYRGKYTEAEPLYKRALAIREKTFGPEHPTVASSWNSLAVLYTALGKFAEAESLFVRSISIDEKALGPWHPNMAVHLEDFSKHYLIKGDIEKALDLAGRAFEIRMKNFGDGSTTMSERDALTYSQFMRQSAENYLSIYFYLGSKVDSAAYSAADVIFSTKGRTSEAVFARAAEINMLDQLGTLADSLRQAREYLSNLYVSGSGDEGILSYREQIDKATRNKERFESELARSNASYRNLQDALDVNSRKVLDVFGIIPGRMTLVEYMKYDYLDIRNEAFPSDDLIPHYLVMVMEEGKVPEIIGLGDAFEIDELVNRYRRHMLRIATSGQEPSVADQSRYQRISAQLYERIWDPIEQHLGEGSLVLIAPDGGLNMVSFAGLIDDNGGYLIEKYVIHYLSSGRDLIRLREPGRLLTGLFALGDPDYNASVMARLSKPGDAPVVSTSQPAYYTSRNVRSGCGELRDVIAGPLPGTRVEIERIADRWVQTSQDPASVYFGTEASEEKFKADAPGKRVVHLATHGYFLERICQPEISRSRSMDLEKGYVGENPLLLSGLLLAGANLHGEGADSLGAEDGILTAEEVTAMSFNGTELVVLSACETGLGEVKQGEGVYGLRRAFQMAGARTVVSALWSVSDEATAEMMVNLYVSRQKSLPEQMRGIQLASIEAFRNQGKPDHPFSWGAFIALGDWR